MSLIRGHSRVLLIAVTCTGLGAAVSAIAAAGAATASHPGKRAHAGRAHAGRAHGLRGLATRAVDADLVVKTKSGFATVHLHRGRVDSVSGRRLSIAEGTRKATYKTISITVPVDAVVRDNRKRASLGDVKPGQRVIVVQGLKRTLVIARTPNSG